jgi:hypothetical protein
MADERGKIDRLASGTRQLSKDRRLGELIVGSAFVAAGRAETELEGVGCSA